jgi:NAD(P)-dependent dehydrogenase (short-subunit alcohol dehydrogenase family)
VIAKNKISGGPALDGLRVLVTAGASGIGRVTADTLAAQGARIYVCDIDTSALSSCPAEYGSSRADVSDPADVEALFAAVDDALGGLDVLVNNAGIAGPTKRIEDIDIADWRRTVGVNLDGQFYCARLAAPRLRATQGAMINMSSVAGRLGYAFRTPYAATKWAIVGLTESLAKELGPDGVRVNAVLPGIVRGKRIEGVIAARAESLGVDYAEVEDRYLSNISLRRMVEPEDIAHTIAFLCSPAGRNISGQSISVCGNVETL